MFGGKTIEDSECYSILFCGKSPSLTVQAILALDTPSSPVSSLVFAGLQILLSVLASTQQDRIRVDFWACIARAFHPNNFWNPAEASIRSSDFPSADCLRDQSDP